jgi:hypothetical protein
MAVDEISHPHRIAASDKGTMGGREFFSAKSKKIQHRGGSTAVRRVRVIPLIRRLR